MFEVALTIIGFAAAMTIPAFLTAIVESAALKLRPLSERARSSTEAKSYRLLPAGRNLPAALRALCFDGRSWRST
jgi:type II secretory pathway pseudopilin PulG